jgi:hypothetical protein
MTPTPTVTTSAWSSSRLWVGAGVVAVFVLLFVAGLVTGAVRVDRSRARKSTGRAAIMLDATLSTGDRQAGLEYLLDDQHRVVLEQAQGDGDEDGPSVLFEYPGEEDREPGDAD